MHVTWSDDMVLGAGKITPSGHGVGTVDGSESGGLDIQWNKVHFWSMHRPDSVIIKRRRFVAYIGRPHLLGGQCDREGGAAGDQREDCVGVEGAHVLEVGTGFWGWLWSTDTGSRIDATFMVRVSSLGPNMKGG